MSLPQAPGVFVREIATLGVPIAEASTSTTAFVGHFGSGAIGRAELVTSFGDFARAFGGLHAHSQASYAVAQYFANGGERAIVLRVQAAAANSLPTAADIEQALPQLDGHEFSLMCVPAMSRMTSDGINEYATLVRVLNDFCEQRGVFLLVDPNVSDHVQAISQFDNSVGSANNAIYFPHVEVVDPLAPTGSALRRVPPSGTIAGILARSDTERGVWKAPAGIHATIRGARAAGWPLTDDEQQPLNTRGINVVRRFGGGDVVWGSRTGVGADDLASEYKYVPVRRTALHIERSLQQGLQWVVFEPNGEALWSQIRGRVEAFLAGLHRSGAFQGAKKSDAYFVRCDHSTMTADDIASGVVNVLVGFAPLKPAEFIVLRLQLQAAAAEV